MFEAKVTEFFKAWGSGDAERISQLFAVDGRLFTDNGHTYIGRDSICAAVKRKLANRAGMQIESVGAEQIQHITNDVAVVELDIKASGAPEGAPGQGRWVSVIKRTGEEWNIVCQWIIATPAYTARI